MWFSLRLATASPGDLVAPMAVGHQTLTGTRLAHAWWQARPSFHSPTPGFASQCSTMDVFALVTSGAPNFLGDTDLVVAIGIGGDFACEAMDAALRLDTPSARAFLGQFVVLP